MTKGMDNKLLSNFRIIYELNFVISSRINDISIEIWRKILRFLSPGKYFKLNCSIKIFYAENKIRINFSCEEIFFGNSILILNSWTKNKTKISFQSSAVLSKKKFLMTQEKEIVETLLVVLFLLAHDMN